MSDYKFEEIIIAYTAGDLLNQLEAVADETVIKTEGGLWAGVSRFALKKETFTDAFDHTEYQINIYEPVRDGGEPCFMLCKKGIGRSRYRIIATVGELKQYLKEDVPLEYKAVAVDENFELNGAITEKVKVLLFKNEKGLALDI